MSDARAPWDPFQREVLEALGHVVYAVHEPEAPPVLQSVAKAANVRVAQLPPLPPIAELRTPAAKRALWPTLRALRKAGRA